MAAYENWKVWWAPASQPDDPFPEWEDLTPWVETVGSPWNAQSGRPTEFDTAQPGTLSLTLNNTDHRFSTMELARQLRVTDTIGCRTYQIFKGWIELPDISDWAESGVDQFITVTAVDRLTRLDRSRKFTSTLTEYIRYNGGAGLQAYYPLLEANGTMAYDKSAYGREPLELVSDWDSTVTPTQGGPAFTAGNGTTLPGDDLAAPTWIPRTNASGLVAESAALRTRLATSITQAGTDTVTLAAWLTLRANQPATGDDMYPIWLSSGLSDLKFDWVSTSGWQAEGSAAANVDVPIACQDLPVGAPMLIAVRMNLAAGTLELWRHADPPQTTALAGSGFGTVLWSSILVSSTGAWSGSISHVQVYLGGSTVYTRAQHLAQVQAGFSGLAGQTTGQRIRTMAAYAGVSAAELQVDNGTVQMPNTSLAGKSPLTPMREAETTEQGLLLANGAGRLVFQDRIHRYNI